MFCKKCGSENRAESSFCLKCGTPIKSETIKSQTNFNNSADSMTQFSNSADSVTQFTQKPVEQQYVSQNYTVTPSTNQTPELNIPKKKSTKRSVAFSVTISVVATVLLVAILYFALGIGANDNKIEGSGHASAEDAVSAYLEAFKNTDVEAMISTFAVETYVENFSLDAYIERIKVYSLTLPQTFPSNNQFTTGLNIQRRQSQIADSIRYQYMSIFIPDAINEGMMTPIDDTQEGRSFIRTLGEQSYYESMRTMSVLGFVSPDSLHDGYTSVLNQRNIDQSMEAIGAQRLESIVARVETNNQIYLFCFDVARYGEKWYIHTLGGNIGTMLGIPGYNMGVIQESDLP